MFGVDYPIIASVALLAASSGNLCQMPSPTKINVLPQTKEVVFETNQSLEEIQAVKTDTVNPYGFHQMTMTQGFMKGSIKISPSIKLGFMNYPSYQASCIWYDTIDVKIEIDPRIVIAREVYADRCMREAVREHEMEHVKVDREIVNKFAREIGNKIYASLEKRGYMVGPVPDERREGAAKQMQSLVFQIVELEQKKMEIERIERQRAIDSLEEYQKVDNACPDYNPPNVIYNKNRR